MPSRFAATAAAAVATLVLATGCTATGWESSAPSGDGVNADSGNYQARNILVVADEEGNGVVLGSLFTSAADASLKQAAIAAHLSDGTDGEVTEVADAEGDIPRPQGLKLAGVAEGADLEAGTTAKVAFQFADGATIAVDAPVYSSDNAAYADAFTDAVG